jgi:hypothetical protein
MTELKENFEKYAVVMTDNDAYPLVGEYGWMSLGWEGTQDIEDILDQVKDFAMAKLNTLLVQGGYHRIGSLSKERNSSTYIRGGMGGRIIQVNLETTPGTYGLIQDRYSEAMGQWRNDMRNYFNSDCEYQRVRGKKPFESVETLYGFFQWDTNPGKGLHYVVMNARASVVVGLDRSQIRHIVELYGNMDMADFEEALINYESN